MELCPITMGDLSVFAEWYCDEDSRFFQQPTERWVKHVNENPNSVARECVCGGVVVGLFQVDIEDGRGDIAVIVDPRMRGVGHGRIVGSIGQRHREERLPLYQCVFLAQVS